MKNIIVHSVFIFWLRWGVVLQLVVHGNCVPQRVMMWKRHSSLYEQDRDRVVGDGGGGIYWHVKGLHELSLTVTGGSHCLWWFSATCREKHGPHKDLRCIIYRVLLRTLKACLVTIFFYTFTNNFLYFSLIKKIQNFFLLFYFSPQNSLNTIILFTNLSIIDF
jgi:hypothetical protein